MAYFVAVDAGGTKTDFVLADEQQVLARARTGTIKRLRADADVTVTNLEQGLAELEQKSGVAVKNVARTCIGTAGESVPLVADWLRDSFATRVGGELLLLGDVEIALDAAFRGGPGVLALAGTGSNVAGRTPEGVLSTCGGWGPQCADQGSGYAIGAGAVRAIFLAIDQDRQTALQQAVMNFWKLSSLDRLIEYANSTPLPDVSQLAQVVVRCAAEGDEVAQGILHYEGENLAYLVRLLIRRLRRLHGADDFTPALAFAGSIMERVMPVRESLIAAVQREFPQTAAMPGVIDPIDGALWRARDEAAFHARMK